MMSIALTSAVVWNGKINVSHSQCEKIAHPKAAVEAKKTSHQIPLYLLVFSMVFFLQSYVIFRDLELLEVTF
jgi:hypothetical protein